MSALRPLAPHVASIGPESSVRRFLPQSGLRRVGAWCFFDHFGPVPPGGGGMDVGPHPHRGLQTATWLFEGEVLHLDSTGARAAIRPGQLNLMTAGRGIAHTEDLGHAPRGLHGAQLWIALPEAERARPPSFAQHTDLPTLRLGDVDLTVAIGAIGAARSPAVVYSPLLLAELRGGAGASEIPLDPGFEHLLLVAEGQVQLAGTALAAGAAASLPAGASSLDIASDAPFTALLLGGAPFEEPILMSWNWVVRTAAEAQEARERWAAGEGHGDLAVFGSRPRISAPPLLGNPVAR